MDRVRAAGSVILCVVWERVVLCPGTASRLDQERKGEWTVYACKSRWLGDSILWIA